MKRILLLLLVGVLGVTLTACNSGSYTTTTEPYTFNFEFIDDYMYDLDDGSYTPNTNFAVSTREAVLSTSIVVSDYHKISYMLFWGKNNDYIGYYALEGVDETKDGYIDTVTSNTITFPTGTTKTAVMVNTTGVNGYYKINSETYLSYTYDEADAVIGDYVIDSIDDNITVVSGYETLTYRDVFGDSIFGTGKTNLFDGGDFTSGSCTDCSNINSDLSIVDGELVMDKAVLSTVYHGNKFKTNDNLMTGDKVYISYDWEIDLTVDSYTLFYSYLDGAYFQTYWQSYSYQTANTRYYESGIYTLEADTQVATYDISFYVRDTTSTDYKIYFDNFIVYDLTDLFGSGSEPTLSDFETMLDEYNRINQFGDGEITLSDLSTALGIYTNHTKTETDWNNQVATMTTDNITTYDYINNINNGNFDDTDLSWWNDYNTIYSVQNGQLLGVGDGVLTRAYVFKDMIVYDTPYYYRYDLETYITSSAYVRGYNSGGITSLYHYGTNLYNTYSLVDDSGNTSDRWFLLDWRNDTLNLDDYVIIDNANLFNLRNNSIWLEDHPQLVDNWDFVDDTNTDGVADGITTFNMQNCNVTGEVQYCEADGTTSNHYLQYTKTTSYTIGDKFGFYLDLDTVTSDSVYIALYQRSGVSTYSIIGSGSFSTASDTTVYVEGTTTSSYSTQQIQARIYLRDSSGNLSYAGSGEAFTVDNMYLYNLNDKDYSDTKTKLDTELSYYTYIDGTVTLPDSEDTDFTDKYMLDITDNGFIYGDTTTYYYQDDIGNILPSGYTWNETNFDLWLSVYYDETYNGTTFTYGDYFTQLDILNPVKLGEILGYSDSELMAVSNTERDYIIGLYWDYENNVSRWEWFQDYGVTSTIYPSFYPEYLIQKTPENAVALATMELVSYSGTRTVNDYTPSNFDDFINDSLDGVGASGLSGDIIYISIMFVIMTVTIIGLILSKANMMLMLFSLIMEMFAFYVLGWVGTWILLSVGAVLTIIVFYIIMQNRGGSTE